MPAFVLIVRPRGDADAAAGYGITATKKLGGAVVRNRAKRRLRAIIRAALPAGGVAGADHVVIGRAEALTIDHPRFVADFTKALTKAHRRIAEPGAGPARTPAR